MRASTAAAAGTVEVRARRVAAAQQRRATGVVIARSDIDESSRS
jgi:hypothetical protein